MKDTPQANRIHIGIFGKCNSGKSSLINALTGQQTAVVSGMPGTTTDPVSKGMEIPGLGACLLMDTAGFDDTGPLATERLKRTDAVADRTDIAIVVCRDEDISLECRWVERFRDNRIPVTIAVNADDSTPPELADAIRRQTGITPVAINAITGEGTDSLLASLREIRLPAQPTLTGNLAAAGDVVVLVMPQDAQAPQGRLILPQAQTIRELLEKRCTVICTLPEQLDDALRNLVRPPRLVITDSQVLKEIHGHIPEESMLTTFSILFAACKGDIRVFLEGARAMENLTGHSRVLIAEACTHAPADEDIGREKIPRLLRRKVGEGLKVDVAGGRDFPKDLSAYDLIIHCGACMFNRRLVLNRIKEAQRQGVPITNYGVAIACLTGTLDGVVFPED